MIMMLLTGCIHIVSTDSYNRSVRGDFPPLYREVLTSWEGSSTEDLLLRWGKPEEVIPLEEGKKIFSYEDLLQGDICFSRFLVDNHGTILKTDTFGPGCYHWAEPYFVYPTEDVQINNNNNDYVQ
jgi:hypothetical protein